MRAAILCFDDLASGYRTRGWATRAAGYRAAISCPGTFETCRLRRAMSEFEVQSGKHMLVLSSSQFDPQRTFSRCLLSSGNVSSCQQNLVVSQLQDWRVRHMGKLAVVATIKTVAGQAR